MGTLYIILFTSRNHSEVALILSKVIMTRGVEHPAYYYGFGPSISTKTSDNTLKKIVEDDLFLFGILGDISTFIGICKLNVMLISILLMHYVVDLCYV